jgi:predicted ferric reductase
MVAIVAGNGVVILAMWIRHGGWGLVTGGFAGFLTGMGQLTGLLGTFLVLIQLLLMSRSPWLEQLFGRHQLVGWHRWVGFSSVTLLVAHTVLITMGYAASGHLSVVDQSSRLLRTYPDVLMATVGLGLFLVVAITSLRAARRRLRHETWYFIHLYAYLAIALSFAHQLATGVDFIDDRIARIYWSALFVVTIGMLMAFRVGEPLARAWRHRLRVDRVEAESPGVFSVYITGRQLDRLGLRGGQFFLWRFLTRSWWWRAHPFSVSAAPNGRYLRITVKPLGDFTHELARIQPGTKVIAEGPYGRFTELARTSPKVLLIAAGVGIVPIRALIEELDVAPGDMTLIYRARSWDDVVFKNELEELAWSRPMAIHWLIGRRGSPEVPADPLSAEALRGRIPQLAQHDVYICGPGALIRDVGHALLAAGVAPHRIHHELFAY